MEKGTQDRLEGFYGSGFFAWQLTGKKYAKYWKERQYNPKKWWGGFSRQKIDPASYRLPDWAIGPFHKHPDNPIMAPSQDAWDSGHFGGGVHNGAVIIRDDVFHYIYRGERRHEPIGDIDYICDIGLATSADGVHFTKNQAHSPFFRKGEDQRYSYEDACVVRSGGSYYLYCNRWDWSSFNDPSQCGAFAAVSDDLIRWEKIGLLFPKAVEIHRNPVVLQDPTNDALEAGGSFLMYLNNGLVARSPDLLHWESHKVPQLWPGGEGCFALGHYSQAHPENLLLFTGGHHSGHFYAVGEVLFSKRDPEKALEWLPRPVLHAEKRYPWEDGFSAKKPRRRISHWRDTVFFTGLTAYQGKWWMYYGGSEYYTCLATAELG
jgi:predicted GH43/DUF377 family glycosyl hydrolase